MIAKYIQWKSLLVWFSFFRKILKKSIELRVNYNLSFI